MGLLQAASDDNPTLLRRQCDALSSFGLTLREEEGRGRCVVATRELQEGDLVMRSEAFASVELPGTSGSRCSFCFTRIDGKRLRCSACKMEYYCNRQCQVQTIYRLYIYAGLREVIYRQTGRTVRVKFPDSASFVFPPYRVKHGRCSISWNAKHALHWRRRAPVLG